MMRDDPQVLLSKISKINLINILLYFLHNSPLFQASPWKFWLLYTTNQQSVVVCVDPQTNRESYVESYLKKFCLRLRKQQKWI